MSETSEKMPVKFQKCQYFLQCQKKMKTDRQGFLQFRKTKRTLKMPGKMFSNAGKQKEL
jgi:hypothetical protein